MGGSRGPGAGDRDPVNPRSPPARRALARSWITESLRCGRPPSGGLLEPPSDGGLCDGVMTIPSAAPPWRLSVVVGQHCVDRAGVGVYPSRESTRTVTR